MIKRPLYKKGEKVWAHWKRDGGTLYEAQIKGVNEDGTYHVVYADGDVDRFALETYIREENKRRRVPEPVKLSAVERHVQVTLASTEEHFNLIFSCLDVGGAVGALAWDLLLLLPPSDTVADTLCSVHKQKEVDWKSILSPAPVKLLYTLQILDPSKLNNEKNPLKDPEWCKIFVAGGLSRLATILDESTKQLIADKLALKCLGMIQKIFSHFLTNSLVDTSVVLKSFPLADVVDKSLKMLPSIVTPTNETVEGNAEATSALFMMLSTAVRVQPSVFSQIKAFGPEWEKVVPAALITNKLVPLQKAFTDGVDQLCKNHTDDSEEVAHLREDLRDKLLGVVNARFSELNTQMNCAQYLLLMRNLIATTNNIEEKSGKGIGTSLSSLILKHPMTEVSPKTQDAVLGALLNLTAELIKKVPVLQQTLGCNGPAKISLLKPVYDMLFMVPTLENSYHLKIRPPQCKHWSTRQAGFNLLVALCSGNADNTKALAELLIPLHFQIHENGDKPYSWEFEPAWKSDADEREGYCGLVNCGNTCYINAALQQIFMQPKLRENILSITDYAHPNPSRPKWEGDELEGLQWLLGNLQESNKRAVRPMFFHQRFEDPDWENQGRPIRGEGAAGHAQADSNGFLQTLLGRIEDRIKKTPMKDCIKAVCGLQFVDQIVGSRAAPYLNYGYSVDEWVGPISLNVNGHKTLHECLKSHVEFKSQNRKVSKEGLFGQKYDKQNVQVFKRTVFKTMPQCLMICLNRMGYDNMGNTLKLNHRISFPTKLNMKPYSEEALFGKLPRGSDTGETERTDAKAKVDPPSGHPEEYYEYELMGVIVHSGRTLQSGHYYSYIRERPPSNKWYCFNDSSISPFDASKLEEETFGSADTDSWKCSTAYVLFYDKVPPKKKVTVKGIVSKVDFAGAANIVHKLQKKKDEATEKIKARATVPRGMLRRIWEENEMKWRDSNVHDRNYGHALREIISGFKKANTSPPEKQPAVEEISDTPSNLYDQVTRLATRYLFMTLARSAGKQSRGWREWVNEVKALYVGNVASSVWLLSMFINPDVDWFSTILMAEYETSNSRNPVQEVRYGAAEVLAEAMRALAPTEKRAIVKASSASVGKRRVRSATPKRTIMDLETKMKGADEKKGAYGKQVPEIVKRPQEGFLLSIINRMLDQPQSPEVLGNAGSSQYHWVRLLAKFAGFGKEEVAYLESVELFDDLVILVEPAVDRAQPEPYDHLPNEYFSLLLDLCKTEEQKELVKRPHFISRLLLEGFSKTRAKPITALICKLCNEDKKALDLVMDQVGKGISNRNHEITRPYYRVLTALLLDESAPDRAERPAKIVGKLCAAFNSQLKFKEGDFLAEHIIRFAKLHSGCANFLQKASAAIERIGKFLSQRPAENERLGWKVGDQVVAKYKNERGVYPGDIKKDNGNGTYYIQYDDGDTWVDAPADMIRARLFPRLNLANDLDKEGLHPQTIKCLQFVLRSIETNSRAGVSENVPEVTGKLDETTVNSLQEYIRSRKYPEQNVTGKLDEQTILHLQSMLDHPQQGAKPQDALKGYPYPADRASLQNERGALGPLTKFFLRKWLDQNVTRISEERFKNELTGLIKEHEATRRELSFHKKGRRYTITCEFAPYSRPTVEKLSALKKISNGEPLDDAHAHDSEDEREDRKFAPKQKIDAYDNFMRKWRAVVVQKVVGDSVQVKFERPQRTKYLSYNKADPHLAVPVGIFSSLKAPSL